MDKNDPRYVEARQRLQRMLDAVANGSQEEADQARREYKEFTSGNNHSSSKNDYYGAPMAVETRADKRYQPPQSSLPGAGQNKSHPSGKDSHNGLAYLGMALAVLAAIASFVPFDAMRKATLVLLIGAALFSITSFFIRRVEKAAAIFAVLLTVICAVWVGFMRLDVYHVFSPELADGIVEEWKAGHGGANVDDDGTVADPSASVQAKSSRENPLPMGTDVSGEHWKVTVNSIQADATQQIMADDEYVDPPKDGYQYLVADVSVTYLGNDPDELKASPSEIDFEYVTEGGNTIRVREDAYSVHLDDELSTNDLYPNATASGTIVFCVPENDGGVLSVDLGTFGDVIDYFEVD